MVTLGSTDADSRRARLQAWIREAQTRVEASRTRSPGVDAAFVVQSRDRAVGGNLLACAIAYRLFLWFLPLSLLVAAALGFAQASSTTQPAELADDVGLARSVVTVVADAAAQAEGSRLPLLLAALTGVYLAGSAGAKTIVAVHRFAWGMSPLGARPGPVASLAFTAAAVAVIGFTLGAQALRRASPGVGLTATLAIGLGFAALWLGASVVLPHGDAPWTRLVPGALFLGAGTQLVHLATVYYLAGKLQKSSELYGSLGVAATLLLGLYFLARLIVGAAVLNATLWEQSGRGRHETITPGG